LLLFAHWNGCHHSVY